MRLQLCDWSLGATHLDMIDIALMPEGRLEVR